MSVRPVSLTEWYPNGTATLKGVNKNTGDRKKSVAFESEKAGLWFSDVCVDVSEKRILWSVGGNAKPGKILVLMGPSGSGKTTLLNCLAGYTQLSSGSITLHGHRMNKRVRRQVSYVLQADIFFPNLTLRETLRYSALLRLPRDLSFREKLTRVENIIELLRLQDCANTLIGSVVARGLSGGEKKRANIGCELLTSPSLLLLDEPTSGLDSSSALSLMETLRHLAIDGNKTIVTSIHQPSSQLFHMFDDLLLLAKGKAAYFGPTNKVVEYFADLGLHCTLHYNPADYILEAVTASETRKLLIGDDPKQETRPRKKRWSVLWRKGGGVEKDGVQPTQGDDKEVETTSLKTVDVVKIEEYASSPRLPRKAQISAVNPIAELADESYVSEADPSSESSSDSGGDSEHEQFKVHKWPTRWYWQFLVLLVRTFRQSRHVILSKLNLIQTIILTAIASIVWFQLPKHEDSISDRYGYLFFTIVYWGFQPLIIATMSFPAEHAVISKERRSGVYRLSAYYLAKTVSELPLVLLQPSLFVIVTYWIVGLNGPASFFGTWFILITNSVVAQGLGFLLGALFMDFSHSLVAAAVVMLTSMLLGGFYVKNLASWIQWAEYLSFITYSFDAMLYLEFTENNFFECNADASSYVACGANFTSTDYANSNMTRLLISGTDVLEQLDVTLPLYTTYLLLVSVGILFRMLAYFALRFLHKKRQ